MASCSVSVTATVVPNPDVESDCPVLVAIAGSIRCANATCPINETAKPGGQDGFTRDCNSHAFEITGPDGCSQNWGNFAGGKPPCSSVEVEDKGPSSNDD